MAISQWSVAPRPLLRGIHVSLVAALGIVDAALPADAFELRGTGVILIHGKAGGQGPLQPLAQALKAHGATVVLPRMSWTSGYRTYD